MASCESCDVRWYHPTYIGGQANDAPAVCWSCGTTVQVDEQNTWSYWFPKPTAPVPEEVGSDPTAEPPSGRRTVSGNLTDWIARIHRRA